MRYTLTSLICAPSGITDQSVIVPPAPAGAAPLIAAYVADRQARPRITALVGHAVILAALEPAASHEPGFDATMEAFEQTRRKHRR